MSSSEVERTIDFVRGFEAGSADKERKILQLQEDVQRLHATVERMRNWALAARYAATNSVEESGFGVDF